MAAEQVKKVNKKSFFKTKKGMIIGGAVGVFVLLVILVVLFGTPSAKTVFSDMQETMLKTKSVTMNQTYKMTSNEGDTVDLKSTASMDMTSSKDLMATGNFSVKLNSKGTPITVGADYIIIGSNKYIRYNELSTSDASLSSNFQTVEGKLKNNWIKVRDNDSFASFSTIQFSTLSNVLPVPYANLSKDQQKVVLAILQDKSTYTIEESTKVDINDVTAYKYTLSYNKDQYQKFEKAISGYVDYFKASDSSGSELKTLNVWVNISTKQIIKIEFTGTNTQGNIEGAVVFSDYNKPVSVTKPADYSIESELLN